MKKKPTVKRWIAGPGFACGRCKHRFEMVFRAANRYVCIDCLKKLGYLQEGSGVPWWSPKYEKQFGA